MLAIPFFFQWVVGLFKSPVSVASLTSDFSEKIEKLKKLSDAKKQEAITIEEQIVVLEDAKTDAENESDQASLIAGRIKALLS